MLRHKLSGVGAAMITPFTADGRVDYKALARMIDYVIDGASYDKLLFIISDENEKLRTFILEDLERSATFIKARGMYSEEEKDMIFLVVDRKEVHAVQRKVQEIDPKAFFVVTDAYDTYGEGFKPFPEAGAIQAQ